MNQKIQDKLKNNKSLANYDVEDMKYLQKPLGKAIYKRGRPKSDNPAKWNDRVICDVCGKEFTRSARTKHKKTQFHQAFEIMNNKLKKLLINDN